MPKQAKNRVKVYTVQVQYSNLATKRWYYKAKGEFFNCVLVSKRCESGIIIPVFCIVQRKEQGFAIPVCIRTIKTEDCLVIREEIINQASDTLKSLIENYAYDEPNKRRA
jgi:hypothetical protein